MFRASVTANNEGAVEGASAEILIDGADTAITANGLGGYTPSPGDRLIVGQVGSQMEIMQFLSTGSIPFADPLTAEKMSLAIDEDDVHVGDNITISSETGITLNQDDGGVTRLPTDGSSPTFTGEVVARALTIENGAHIAGSSDVSGTIDLNAQVNDPTAAPTVDAYYDVRDMAAEYGQSVSSVGLTRNLADDGWVTIITAPDLGANRWRFLEVLDDNTVNTYLVTNHGQNAMGGIVNDGSFYYYMYRTSTANWYGNKIATLGGANESGWPLFKGTHYASRTGLGINEAGELLVATLDGAVSTVRIDNLGAGDNWSIIDSTFLASGVAGATDINGVFSMDSHDYHGPRHIIQFSTGVRVYNTTAGGGFDGTYVSADGWAKPYNWTPNGLYWNPSTYYFHHLDPFGRIARLEPKNILGDSQSINGTFDANTTGWAASALGTLTWDAAEGRLAAGAAKLVSTAGSAQVRLERQPTYAAVVAGTQYTVSAWVKGTQDRTASVSVDFRDAALAFVNDSFGTTIELKANVWQRVEVTGTPTGAAVWAQPKVSFGADNIGDTFYIDDIQFGGTQVQSWWAYALVDSDTHTTLPSPRTAWTPPNRSLVTVTSATPPQATDPGTHVANRLQVFAATSNVATLYEQGGHLPVGIVAWPYNPIREIAVAAPGSNNFGAVAVAGELRSDAVTLGERTILLKGSGAGRTGPRGWDDNGAPVMSTQIPAITVYKTSAQTLTLNTTVVVPMDVERFASADNGGMVLTSGVIQVPIEGWYQVDCCITWAASTSSARRLLWIGYGSTTSLPAVTHVCTYAWAQDTSNFTSQTTSGLVYLAAGEYVGVKANPAVNFGLDVSQTYMNNLSVHWVG